LILIILLIEKGVRTRYDDINESQRGFPMSTEIDFTWIRGFFRISPEGAENPVLELPGTDLLDGSKLLPALEAAGRIVRATGLELPASFAGLTLCNLCAVSLIVMARHNRMPDLSLSNLTFQLELQGSFFYFGYKIHDLRWKDIPESPGTERAASAVQEWIPWFREAVVPAVEAIAAGAGVKPELIWGQFGGHLARVREFAVREERRDDALTRLDHDVRTLTGLPAELFRRKRNPFVYRPRYIEDPYRPGERMMMRSSCCMYYCRAEGAKCYNCPRLTSEERESMRQAIAAQSQSR